jgi:hypothetical protein
LGGLHPPNPRFAKRQAAKVDAYGTASPRPPSEWGVWNGRLRRTFQTPHPNHLARSSIRFFPCARCCVQRAHPSTRVACGCVREPGSLMLPFGVGYMFFRPYRKNIYPTRMGWHAPACMSCPCARGACRMGPPVPVER